MMVQGFTFPCANLDQFDDASERFFDANPNDIYNPFPQTVRRNNLRQARTQPLVRIRYEPCPSDNLWPRGAFDFKKPNKLLEFIHELEHIDRDDTPAKSWARYIQGRRFRNLDYLLWAETWDTKVAQAWSYLCDNYKALSSIASRIVLSEELLATAYSFLKTEVFVKDSSPKFDQWQASIKDFEEAYIDYYTKLFGDVRTLYFETIKKVMTWIEYAEDSLTSRLLDIWTRFFLQGLNINGEPEDCVLDSRQQCLLLAEFVKEIDSPAQYLAWIQKNGTMDQMISLFLAYEIQDQLGKESRDTAAETLWEVSRARITRKGQLVRAPKRFNQKEIYFPDRDRPNIVLYPRLLGTHWYIQPGVLLLKEPSYIKYVMSGSVMGTLKLEALLEQLEERDGICCPYYRFSADRFSSDIPQACRCYPEWKTALVRILQWAREGKFGPGGTWRDLPPECSSGV